MKKLAIALAGVAFLAYATPIAKADAVKGSWGATYDDQYAGITWDKHWNKDTKQLESATNAQAADWMADLPDRMFVAHVSIPGAHDFVTGKDGVFGSAAAGRSVTQSVEIDEMMDRGIRGIDLRPGMDGDVLYCNHGLDQTNLTMDEVLGKMTEFLSKHQTEFFVVHLFRGNVYRSGEKPRLSGVLGAKDDADSQAKYNRLMKQLFETKYGAYVVEYRPNLTVEEARGKMVIFTRDRIDFVHLDKQARLVDWDGANNNPDVAASATNEQNAARTTKLWVQDISSGSDLTTKINHFQAQTKRMREMPTPQEFFDANKSTEGSDANKSYLSEWCFNFTSMEYDSNGTGNSYATNKYKYGAKAMAPIAIQDLTTNLGSGPVGVFFADYVLRTTTKLHNYSERVDCYGDQLVYKVIENNFAGANPPVVRYAIPEEMNVNTYPNPYAGQTFFLKHKSTGLWVCGGLKYGSLAALDEYGYPLSIDVDSDKGFMKLQIPGGGFFKQAGTDVYVDGNSSNATPAEFYVVPGQTKGTVVFTLEINGQTMAVKPAPAESAADNLKYCLQFLPYEVGDKEVELEAVTLKQRIAELEKANPERPYNATFYVDGYSSGNGWNMADNASWEFNGKKRANFTQKNNENGAYMTIYNDERGAFQSNDDAKWTMTATFSDLLNGTYKLDMQLFSFNQGNKTRYTINGTKYAVEDVSGLTNNADNVLNEFKKGTGYKEYYIDVTDNKLTIPFEMQEAKRQATAFFFDNIHLTYYGPKNKDEETITVDFPNEWNTVILPFKVEDLANLNNDGIQVYKVSMDEVTEMSDKDPVSGEVFKAHLITPQNTVNEIAANVPYIVHNDNGARPEHYDEWKNGSNRAPRLASVTSQGNFTYQFVGHPTNYENIYSDENNFLTGAIEDDIVDPGHYHLGDNNVVQFFEVDRTETGTPVSKNRAFINLNSGVEHSRVYFDDKAVLTGVESVAVEAADEDAPVDVYTVGGVMVRSQVEKADALTDLPRGIYILRGANATIKVAK